MAEVMGRGMLKAKGNDKGYAEGNNLGPVAGFRGPREAVVKRGLIFLAFSPIIRLWRIYPIRHPPCHQVSPTYLVARLMAPLSGPFLFAHIAGAPGYVLPQ